MKRGIISLLLSLVIGISYLADYFRNNPYALVPGDYEILGYVVKLVHLHMQAHIILIVFGVLVNLLALCAHRSSLAMGAAVFYGVAIAFSPESWPYIILELLFCVLAAALIREKDSGERAARDPFEPRRSRFVLQGDTDLSSAAGQSSQIVKTLNGKPLNGKSMSQNSPGSHVTTINGKPIATKRPGIMFILIMVITVSVIIFSFAVSRVRRTVSSKNSTVNVSDVFPEAPDLSGRWATNDTGSSGMSAQIGDGKITVYWVNTDGSKNLYWSGTCGQLKEAGGGYSWMSFVDRKEMKDAPFAAKEATKIFTYTGGNITYQAKVSEKLEVTFRLHRVTS